MSASAMQGGHNQPQSEYKHSLAFRVRHYMHLQFTNVCAVIMAKPAHRLQICPIVHNYSATCTTAPSYIRIWAVLWECGKEQTDRHIDGPGQYTFRLRYASQEM